MTFSTASVGALPLRTVCVCTTPGSDIGFQRHHMITARFTHFTVHLFRERLNMSMKSWASRRALPHAGTNESAECVSGLLLTSGVSERGMDFQRFPSGSARICHGFGRYDGIGILSSVFLSVGFQSKVPPSCSAGLPSAGNRKFDPCGDKCCELISLLEGCFRHTSSQQEVGTHRGHMPSHSNDDTDQWEKRASAPGHTRSVLLTKIAAGRWRTLGQQTDVTTTLDEQRGACPLFGDVHRHAWR